MNIFLKHKTYDRFIVNNSFQDIVKFHGVKTGTDKWEFYSKAAIFCLPTYETEAMPITLLEAMMFELPIITTNWRGIPEIVKDKVNGFLVPAKDPAVTAETIEMLCKNSSLREITGKKGREIFLEKFTLNHHLNKMEEVFQKVISTDA